MNGQNKLALWAGRISECRNSGMNVKVWCKENGVCGQTYCKWQRRLFELAQMQQEVQFTEVTPVRCGNIAVTVRIAGAEADIHVAKKCFTLASGRNILIWLSS